MLFMIGLKDPIQNWLKILNLSQINVDKRGLVRDEKTKAHKVTRKKQTKGIIWWEVEKQLNGGEMEGQSVAVVNKVHNS